MNDRKESCSDGGERRQTTPPTLGWVAFMKRAVCSFVILGTGQTRAKRLCTSRVDATALELPRDDKTFAYFFLTIAVSFDARLVGETIPEA